MKNILLKKSLENISQFGFSKRAISEAAKSLGYPSSVVGLFPRGNLDLIEEYSLGIEEQVKTRAKINSNEFYENCGVLLKERLEIIKPEMDIWKSAVTEMAKPENMKFGFDNLTRFSDEFCYLAGDMSFNFRYYTRRAALASIISSSDLFLFNDFSEDKSSTEQFLMRNLARAKTLEANGDHAEQVSKAFLSFFSR